MDPFLGLIGSIGGGLLNNIFAGERQEEAQTFAREQAATAQANFRLNRQTAYQDTMSDMYAAGLNPILAYQRGASGSTMSPTPSPSAAPVHDVGLGSGINSAIAIRRANQDLENLKSTQTLTDAQTEKTEAETRTQNETTSQVRQNTSLQGAETALKVAAIQKALLEMREAESLNDFAKNNPAAFNLLVQSGYVGSKVNSALSPVWEGAGALKMPFLKSGSAAYDFNSGKSARYAPGSGPGESAPGKQFERKGDFNPGPGKGYQPASSHKGGWFSDRYHGGD